MYIEYLFREMTLFERNVSVSFLKLRKERISRQLIEIQGLEETGQFQGRKKAQRSKISSNWASLILLR